MLKKSPTLRAKRKLGQNFLKNPRVARELVRAANIKRRDVVIEIGPGRGIVTKELVKRAKKVIAIEKDKKLVEVLQKKFSEETNLGKLELVHADILTFNPSSYAQAEGTYKLVGSIPYYITGALLKRFLSIKEQPKTIAFIIQKEVARRICGPAKAEPRNKESILSISVKTYGAPQYVKTIKAREFRPQPKVDSAILIIENISRDFFEKQNINENKFFTLVKAGFAGKRKKLSTNLKGALKKSADSLSEIFESAGIPSDIRAEDLSLDKWAHLYHSLFRR